MLLVWHCWGWFYFVDCLNQNSFLFRHTFEYSCLFTIVKRSVVDRRNYFKNQNPCFPVWYLSASHTNSWDVPVLEPFLSPCNSLLHVIYLFDFYAFTVSLLCSVTVPLHPIFNTPLSLLHQLSGRIFFRCFGRSCFARIALTVCFKLFHSPIFFGLFFEIHF